jgi:hypothetical protein
MNKHTIENDDTSDSIRADWYIPMEKVVTTRIETPQEVIASRMNQLHQLSLMLHCPDETPLIEEPTPKSIESNNRQFARCAIVEDRTTGILFMNGRSFDCRLVEISIGGFGVVIAGQPKFFPGTIGSLRAPGLNYIVSVTRQEVRDGGAFVGLKQLEEILDRKQRLPGQPSPVLGYLIAGLSGALIATLMYFFKFGT